MKIKPSAGECWKCWIDDGESDYTVFLKKLNKGWKNGKTYVSPQNVTALCRMIKDSSQAELPLEEDNEDKEGDERDDAVSEV